MPRHAISHVRAALRSRVLTSSRPLARAALLSLGIALAACGDNPTDPTRSGPGASTGAFSGSVVAPRGFRANLAGARVALYRSESERYHDTVFRQVALTGTGPSFAFSMPDVPAGTYYVDICVQPVSAQNCLLPDPDAPVTVAAGRTTVLTLRP